jgi:hypothetical protein
MKPIAVVVGVIFFAALLVFSVWTRDSRIEPPVRAGHYWSGKTNDSWVIAYVTTEERGRRRALTPGRNSSYTTDHYNRCRVTVRKLPDGVVVSEVLLGDVLRKLNKPAPQIVGIVGDVLWLWDGMLTARSLPDLAVRYDETTLRTVESASADLIPREAKQFKMLASPAGLLMRGRDARFYLIDPANFALTPVPATDLPKTSSSTRPENWFDFILTSAEGRSMTSPYNQMTLIVLDDRGTWLGMLSDSEAAELPKWVAHENRPSGDVARSLYRTTYTRDDRYAIIEPKSIQRMSEANFLQGGFVFRHGWKPWQMRDPDSVLALSKRRLGATESWHLSRLRYDGQSAWTTDTGLVDPYEFLDAGPFLLISGKASSQKAGREETALWFDERTGAKTTLQVSTGEVRH